MSELFTGSICLTDLIEKAKSQHSSFMKSEANKKIYANILIWKNDEADKFGNTISLQLNSKKELKDSEGKFYIGNAKKAEAAQPQPLTANDAKELELPDDLPF